MVLFFDVRISSAIPYRQAGIAKNAELSVILSCSSVALCVKIRVPAPQKKTKKN
jgi:hypothetical protein